MSIRSTPFSAVHDSGPLYSHSFGGGQPLGQVACGPSQRRCPPHMLRFAFVAGASNRFTARSAGPKCINRPRSSDTIAFQPCDVETSADSPCHVVGCQAGSAAKEGSIAPIKNIAAVSQLVGRGRLT